MFMFMFMQRAVFNEQVAWKRLEWLQQQSGSWNSVTISNACIGCPPYQRARWDNDQHKSRWSRPVACHLVALHWRRHGRVADLPRRRWLNRCVSCFFSL